MTKAQKLASDPSGSVYVAASAGSGKTKVLTDRVLRILLSGTNPGKIMCLTFTKAAAAEMANRINKSLMQWAIASDDKLCQIITNLTSKAPSAQQMQLARKLFVEVLETPDGIKIQTIHSFCQNLMSRFPLEAGIAPHFQVIDEQTSLELLKESRMRLLSGSDNLKEPIKKAISEMAWRIHESNFNELLLEITNQRQKLENLLSKLSVDEIIENIYKTLSINKNDSPDSIIENEYGEQLVKRLKNAAVSLYEGLKSDIDRANKITTFANSPTSENFSEYKNAFLKKSSDTDEQLASIATNKIKDNYPDSFEFLIREQNHVAEVSDKLKSIEIAYLSENLFHISEAVLELYRKAKNSRAYLDYNDLIIATNRLLSTPEIAPWILYKLDGGIDHLLIDEAQDTSPEQWVIIETLCEEFFAGDNARENNRTIFIVGDEKQSIFSFQGADPKVFHKMQEVFAQKASNAQKGWQSVSLDISFRSTDPVLKLVDKVFANELTKKAITFKPEPIAHTAFRNQHAGRIEVWPLVEKGEKEQLESWQLPDITQRNVNTKKQVADKIALTIKSWLDEKRLLKSHGRAVEAGDIMILVRRRNILVDYISSALKRNNVPVAGNDRLVLTDHIAVMDLIAVGNFLLLPEDDLNLAAVLKTPFIALSEDELFEVAYGRGKKTLWNSLREKAESSERFAEAFNYLNELLNKTDFIAPFKLFSYILEAKAGRIKLIERLGNEINDPVDEFLNMAINYERTHIPSLQGFLNWLLAGQTEIKRDLEQGASEVRIMTVHGSKGLQAPIIFMPDTTAVPKNKGGNILWSGSEFPSMLWAGSKKNMNNLCHDLVAGKKQIAMDEYMRLLYVALTRAEDELYICGTSDSNKLPEGCWYETIRNAIEATAKKQDDILVIESAQQKEVSNDNQSNIVENENITLPDFVYSAAPNEPEPSIPLAPSISNDDNPSVTSPLAGKAVMRGKLIHKLLQYLPEITEEKRKDFAISLVNKADKEFSKPEQDAIIESVFKILNHPQIAKIFKAGSKAEVPVAGVFGKFVLSGQIDRLVVDGDEVLIVDYKTNQKPPESIEHVHKNYLNQMHYYKLALSEVYPNKEIKCALIWTQNAQIMMIE